MLMRTASGISVDVETTQLVPGTYTLWWSIYNEPEGIHTLENKGTRIFEGIRIEMKDR